jgi:type I restriction enzyme M protein
VAIDCVVAAGSIQSNPTPAGDHFTPREVIALMVDILFHTQDDVLTKPGTVRTIYDAGSVSTAYDHFVEMNTRRRPRPGCSLRSRRAHIR